VEKHPNQWRRDELLDRFGRLALGMQEWAGGHKIQLGIDTAAGLLVPAGESIEQCRNFLEQAQIASGIVTLRGKEIAFWHRSFQEYLAARTLSGLPDAKLGVRAKKFLYSPEGREVLPLLAGRMVESGRERLDDLFRILISDAVAQKTLERKAHAMGVLGNMLADLTPNRYELSGPAQTQFGHLRETVLVIFERGKTENIGLKTRVSAAEALDQASQSRLLVPGDPDYWVEIPAGTFTIGDPEAFQSLPVQSVTLPTFQLGRFPVTVWEYGKYLADTSKDAPPEWDEQQTHPGRPVTRVSWHDAQSYCEWASRKWTIRCVLPTERQWEFAARGPESRIYPWGPEDQQPDEHRANFGEKVGAPTPVGMFPDGGTPEGVADMAGNVWEWVADWYDDEKESRALRGGSWYFHSTLLRAADRLGDGPGGRDVSFGFRCVR
jgi:formylglycine-generating enzyme required for sulfatase activity